MSKKETKKVKVVEQPKEVKEEVVEKVIDATEKEVKISKVKRTTISKDVKDSLLKTLQSREGKVVNVRSLHQYISNTDFSAFFKRLVIRYDLQEGKHYTSKKGEGRKIEYFLSKPVAIQIINDIDVKEKE